jgi:hypothetical protein
MKLMAPDAVPLVDLHAVAGRPHPLERKPVPPPDLWIKRLGFERVGDPFHGVGNREHVAGGQLLKFPARVHERGEFGRKSNRDNIP